MAEPDFQSEMFTTATSVFLLIREYPPNPGYYISSGLEELQKDLIYTAIEKKFGER